MCSKYEFCDWMPYEEKYWRNAPEEPGVVQTRVAMNGEYTFIGCSQDIKGYLKRRDPKKYTDLSGCEKNLVDGGGELEVRYAVTDSIKEVEDLKHCLIHKYKEEHDRLPYGQKLTPSQCPRGRSGGCTICKE